MKRDENATQDDAEHESHFERPARRPTRRSLLASALAGGGLLTGPDLVLGQSTATPSGPPAPAGLETTLVTGGSGVGLTWEAPVDPCEGDLDHYVITVDGSEATTVPAGITHATVDASLGTNTFGVRAVDEAGATSPTTTDERDVSRYDRRRTVRARPTPDAVAEGETTKVELGVFDPPPRESSEIIERAPAFEATVSLSAGCLARITDVTFAEPYRAAVGEYDPADHAVASIVDDGSAATLTVSRSPEAPFDPYWFGTMAQLEVEGLQDGRVQTDVDLATLETAWGDAIAATPWPDALRVTPETLDPPADVVVDGFPPDQVRLSWSPPANPCDSSLAGYVVSVDGREVNRLPAGATRAVTHVDSGVRNVEVRAVGPDGVASPSVGQAIELAGVADPGTVLELVPERNPIAPGQSVPVHLELVEILTGIERAFTYELTLSLGASCVASLTDVSIPAESYVSDPESVDKISTSVADDGSTASIRGWFHPDIFSDSSAYRYRIGTVEVTGEHLAGVTLEVDVQSMVQEASGDSIPVLEEWTAVTVSEDPARPPAVGDNENRPRDPDVDGRFEDVNGNGERELADVVDLFQHRESDAVADNVGAYDFSGNRDVDLADAVQLFTENTG